MNTSITQATQNDKQISKSIKRFFTRFHISSALKASNAYKRKGIPVTEIFQYLFLLIFSNRSMYMSLLTGRNTPDFAKDTVYRFMKMVQINWMRFTTILASRIIKDAINLRKCFFATMVKICLWSPFTPKIKREEANQNICFLLWLM